MGIKTEYVFPSLYSITGDIKDVNTLLVTTSQFNEIVAKQLSNLVKSSLHTFLDEAAAEGLVLDGVDAAELYIQLFPELYYENSQ